ncbi:MAG: hypothetical protein WAT39_07620 [Planctomycetota bacterium]
MHTATFLLSLLALTPACVTQQTTKPPTKDPFVVEAGETTLPALIDRCAAYLDRNILTSASEMATANQGGNQIRFQKRIETGRDGCEELLTTMLYRAGFALTQLDDGQMFEVIALAGPRGREVASRAQHRTAEQALARPNLKVFVTVPVPLQHINATIATNALRPFFASSGGGGGSVSIGNVGNSSALLVSGFQDQVVQAIRLVRECDVPAAKMEPDLDQRLSAIERRLKAIKEQLAERKQPAK